VSRYVKLSPVKLRRGPRLMKVWEPLIWPISRAVSTAFHTPQFGDPHCHRGPKIQSRHHLSPQRKLRCPKLKYESLEVSEVRGPFERKVLMHYSYFGPLWKQGIYTLQLLLGARLKAKWPTYTVHCSCCWAPLKARYFTHYSWEGGSRQVPRLSSLKHTAVYNPDNDFIWE